MVRTGGELADKKGINKQGGGLSANALTEKDARDIEIAMASAVRTSSRSRS